MNVLIAVLVVGVGSLAFRVLPLLGARRIPEVVSRFAGWAGLSVLAAITVRAVVLHQDPALPVAPLFALVAVAPGLLAAFAGRSPLTALSVSVATYVLLAAGTAAFR